MKSVDAQSDRVVKPIDCGYHVQRVGVCADGVFVRKSRVDVLKTGARVMGATLLVATLGVTTAHGALAEPAQPGGAKPTATPTATPSAPSGGSDQPRTGDSPDDKAPLTKEQVKDQLSQAARLQADLSKTNVEYAQASAKLEALSAQSQAAMNEVATAKALEATARAQEAHQLAVLKALNAQVQDARDDVQHMAYEAYVNGPGVLADMAAILDLVGRGAEEAKNAGTLDYLAEGRAADEAKFRALAQQQQVAAQKAVAARLAREAATKRAEAAQAKVATALLAQRAAIESLQQVRQSTADQLGELGYDVQLPTAPLDLDAINNLAKTPLCTEDNGNYPNGYFPASALCPIIGHPGDMMRPAAARGLNALKAAYESDLGEPLCITDTYRPYNEQVIVARQSPGLAAKPGRSKHGLGLAVDLCGGVESFGTREHLWMKQHAPLFGFFHPAWAEPTGSMPEPWHWEYTN